VRRPKPQHLTRRYGLIVAIVAGVAGSWLLQALPKAAQPLELTPVVAGVLDDPGSPRAGPTDADVTIVIFTDYRCTICQATDPALERLLAKDPKVRVIFKDWPIRGADSTIAAHAALASDRQGRYRAFHTALMASRGPLDPPRIDRIAAEAGLDVARLRADQVAHATGIDAQLRRHAFQAFGLGLKGTPAYLVGPFLIQGGLDDGQLASAVRRARRAAR
jgi:protein-disulfide isomerase